MTESSSNNIFILNNLELTSQEMMLLNSLIEFYNINYNFTILQSIVNGTNKISRRTIEYFVTNYAGTNKISFDLIEKKELLRVYVHNSYKDQLKAHRKKYFDPFGRGIRIPYFTDNDYIITTIGQLNFYKWFISKKIYNYCIENYDVIQNSLLDSKQGYTKKKKNNFKIKNNNKSIPLKYDYISKNNLSDSGDIIVSFDF